MASWFFFPAQNQLIIYRSREKLCLLCNEIKQQCISVLYSQYHQPVASSSLINIGSYFSNTSLIEQKGLKSEREDGRRALLLFDHRT